MQCPQCGNEILNDSIFCEFCGARIKKSKTALLIILSVVLAVVIAVATIAIIKEQQERKAELARQDAECQEAELLKYVDLGLPSRTLWRNLNEGGDNRYYTYDDAVSKYGEQLPTLRQLLELKDECEWTWMGNGYKVTGPNGNSIVLPAAGGSFVFWGDVTGVGSHGYYWSSTLSNSEKVWCLFFNSNIIHMHRYNRSCGCSVRLVKLLKYVDLGLPSGTLWKNANEGGDAALYTYDDAVSMFGNQLPTLQQLEELKDECEWTWIGNGYKVTGPNGNSIVLPAAGYRDCDGTPYGGTRGRYRSSTNYSDYPWGLYFDSSRVGMMNYDRCSGWSVRLVQ